MKAVKTQCDEDTLAIKACSIYTMRTLWKLVTILDKQTDKTKSRDCKNRNRKEKKIAVSRTRGVSHSDLHEDLETENEFG